MSHTKDSFDIEKLKIYVDHVPSSGMLIKVAFPEEFNCVEFSFKKDTPITLFHGTWVQFEPANMIEFKSKVAHEIVRRAVNYTSLLDEVSRCKEHMEHQYNRCDRARETVQDTFDMWKNERVQYGKKEDFSDIETWPGSLRSDYDRGEKNEQQEKITALAKRNAELVEALKCILKECGPSPYDGTEISCLKFNVNDYCNKALAAHKVSA